MDKEHNEAFVARTTWLNDKIVGADALVECSLVDAVALEKPKEIADASFCFEMSEENSETLKKLFVPKATIHAESVNDEIVSFAKGEVLEALKCLAVLTLDLFKGAVESSGRTDEEVVCFFEQLLAKEEKRRETKGVNDGI